MGVVSRSWDGGVNAGRDPAELRHALGVPIMPASLERALTHRSYAYENDNPPTNERLEFLGDSVLGLVVTDTLYRGYPSLPEGQLAKLRAAVVQMGALAEVARELSLGAYVRLGRGEQVTGGRNKPSILADTLEAVIGAVYIDCGLDEARALVHRLFDPVIARSARLGAGLDWKTSLQELTAVKMLGVPRTTRSRSALRSGSAARCSVPVRDAPRRRPSSRPPSTPGGPSRPRRTATCATKATGQPTGRATGQPTGESRSARPCLSCPRSRRSGAASKITWSEGPSIPSASCTRAPCAGSPPERSSSKPPWPGAA